MYRIGQEEIEAVARAILSRDFFKINGAGHEVLEFDKEWAQTVGSDYALTMTSGFAALTSALIGLGVGPGDEVIVPGYTYIASALAVTTVGAIPVIAEIDGTMTLDPADVEKKIAKLPNHEQCFPVGIPSPIWYYVGCPSCKDEGINLYRSLCSKYPNHPAAPKTASGLTLTQKMML